MSLYTKQLTALTTISQPIFKDILDANNPSSYFRDSIYKFLRRPSERSEGKASKNLYMLDRKYSQPKQHLKYLLYKAFIKSLKPVS